MPPDAYAILKGDASHPRLHGKVFFYQTPYGVLVNTTVIGLPTARQLCASPIFAFHIHENGRCQGDENDPFADVGAHYNPENCPHPFHRGDLPPLFGANGYAYASVLSNRFTVEEILTRAVILHQSYDDFETQPSGNAQGKIACGVILANRSRRRLS
ncbi:MAG: superoxide dismutase family protein [Clostridia bacterium]|nr:superoxide dismutase family protein [Clostridia bacterium]